MITCRMLFARFHNHLNQSPLNQQYVHMCTYEMNHAYAHSITIRIISHHHLLLFNTPLPL
jgi:DNA-directed RNA polymerase subunit L